jgi:SH3-binding, glutamic acid-rich protein
LLVGAAAPSHCNNEELQSITNQHYLENPAAMADSTPKSYSTDPILYLYTSLTSGSSHIVTATSRLETILKANRIPFRALDIATDEKARMLWGRRSGKDESGRVRKIPGLVQMGLVIGVRIVPCLILRYFSDQHRTLLRSKSGMSMAS